MTESSTRRPVVAIVGGGFSGAAVAFHLMRLARAALEIVLIEPASDLGRGLAYSTPCDSHLLNVPAGRLGLDPEHEAGFADWLQARGEPAPGSSFVPRRLLGDYVGDELARGAAIRADQGVVFRHWRARAQSLARTADGFTLRLSDGGRLQADAVVLATGHLPPALPAGRQAIDWTAAGMAADPWRRDGADKPAPTQDLLLVGSGLTAVDVVMQWRDAGHRGRFHLLSRRGMLPQAHRHNETRPALLHVPADLQEAPDLRRAVAIVRRWIARTEAEGGDWRDAIASLRASTPQLWGRLTMRDRRRFLRHLQPFWDTHRHRFAAPVHERMQALRAAGDLTLAAGRLASVERLADGQLRVHWTPRGDGPPASVVVGAVVNCTGPTASLAQARDPLLASLRDAGLLSADPLGLGLRVDASLQALDARGRSVDGLYCVGPMLKAQRWEAVAVPELRAHARDVARQIASALS